MERLCLRGVPRPGKAEFQKKRLAGSGRLPRPVERFVGGREAVNGGLAGDGVEVCNVLVWGNIVNGRSAIIGQDAVVLLSTVVGRIVVKKDRTSF